jgi:glycosyltransferase involved in cell wall biosynthesis
MTLKASPFLTFIVTAKSRLDHLQATLPGLLQQPDCHTIVVDYDCPQDTKTWVKRNHSKVEVVHVRPRPEFNTSEARNRGALTARTEWLCFLDADVAIAPHFCETVRPLLDTPCFVRFGRLTPGLSICRREDFLSVGGFDETFRGWGCEDDDFLTRLRLHRVSEKAAPPELVTIIEHSDEKRMAHRSFRKRWLSLRINGLYFQIKTDLARQLGLVELPKNELRSIYEEVARVVSGDPDHTVEIRIALPGRIDFIEPPGWRLRREWLYRFVPADTHPQANLVHAAQL